MLKNGRRYFLKLISGGIIAVLFFIWNKLVLSHTEQIQQTKHVFPFQKNKTVSFNDRFIIVSKNNKTNVFLSSCTHLGCSIKNYKKDKLVCPCHGSEYNLSGIPVKGPAYKPLQKVDFSFIDNKSAIEIIE